MSVDTIEREEVDIDISLDDEIICEHVNRCGRVAKWRVRHWCCKRSKVYCTRCKIEEQMFMYRFRKIQEKWRCGWCGGHITREQVAFSKL